MADFLDKQKVTLDGETVNATFTPPAAGTAKHLYTKTVGLAFNASVNQDHLIPAGKTWRVKSIIVTSGSVMRAEVACGPAASLVTKSVAFTNATKSTTQIFFDPPISIVETSSTDKITVFITNLGAASDVYSTVILEETP